MGPPRAHARRCGWAGTPARQPHSDRPSPPPLPCPPPARCAWASWAPTGRSWARRRWRPSKPRWGQAGGGVPSGPCLAAHASQAAYASVPVPLPTAAAHSHPLPGPGSGSRSCSRCAAALRMTRCGGSWQQSWGGPSAAAQPRQPQPWSMRPAAREAEPTLVCESRPRFLLSLIFSTANLAACSRVTADSCFRPGVSEVRTGGFKDAEVSGRGGVAWRCRSKMGTPARQPAAR